jgi:hypothetical protein
MAVHTLMMAALCLTYVAAAKRRADSVPRIASLFVIVTSALGPVGACGALFAAMLLRLWASGIPRFDAWYPAAIGDGGLKQPRSLYRHVMNTAAASTEGNGVVPFADVLSGGTLEQKQAVIVLIANRFRPAFAPALLGALNDEDSAVRVLAASAVARIETKFLETSIALEARHGRESGDFAASWHLACHYDDYANTGLLDDTRALAARQRALDLYRRCERERPEALEVIHAISRLLVRLGREVEAVEALSPAVARGAVSAETLTWYIECLYRCGRYAALRETCRSLQRNPAALAPMSVSCLEAIALWSCDQAD